MSQQNSSRPISNYKTTQKVLRDIANERPLPGTSSVLESVGFLTKHGMITNTPETTPRLRLTDKGRAMVAGIGQ